MKREEQRKAIRKLAQGMDLANVRGEYVRLAKEASYIQALADAWRKAYTMEARRRKRGGEADDTSDGATP